MTQLPLTGAGPSAGSYIAKVLSYNPIAYWPLNELTGATANCLVNAAQDGAYTGVTLGQTVTDANGVSFICPFFDGANDFVDIYSATLGAAFDGGEGSIMIWMKVNAAAVWTDGINRVMMHLGTNATDNYLRMMKESANNRVQWIYNADGTLDSDTKTGLSDTDWVMVAMTWSATGDLIQYFYDGALEDTDTGLGTYDNGLVENFTNIGSQTETPGLLWHGWLAHPAILGRALTVPEIADLAVA